MKQWTVIFTITCLLLGEFPLYGSPDAAMCRSVYFEPQRQQECLKTVLGRTFDGSARQRAEALRPVTLAENTVYWNRDAIRAFNPGTSYDYKLQWTRGATRQSIRQFIGRPYEWEGNSLHGTDCSGLIHRILFNGFTYQDKSAATYYKEAQKISGAITNEPKPGDVFFLDWSPVLGGNSDIDHTGFVDNCGYEGSGRKVCRIVHATGTQENPDKVRESIIVQNPDGKWDYYQDIGWYEKGRSPTDMARGESVKHAENLSFRFANSLKMRGLPTAQEVARQETIGRAGVAAQKTLGGVDLNAPFPLDGRSLGLGELRGLRLSGDSQSLTIYADRSDAGVTTKGVNPSDVVEILKSYQRTGRAPSFTLLPSQQTADKLNQAMSGAFKALAHRGPLRPSQTERILYGQNVWNFIGIDNPSSFPMQAMFSDQSLTGTHAGTVLMASDLLLKTLAIGGPGQASGTPFLDKAAQLAKTNGSAGSLETSRFWFEADPDSFRVYEIEQPDGSVIWDFAEPKIRVSCRPIQWGGINSAYDNNHECAPGSLSAWYADYLTQNMDSLAENHQVIKELKELYKASSLAALLHQKGVRMQTSAYPQAPSAWPTPATADFLPVLYISRPDNQGNIGMLMAVGGGGVDLNVAATHVTKLGSYLAPGSFYHYQPQTPIGDADESIRAVRFNLGLSQAQPAPGMTTAQPYQPQSSTFPRPQPNRPPEQAGEKPLAGTTLDYLGAMGSGAVAGAIASRLLMESKSTGAIFGLIVGLLAAESRTNRHPAAIIGSAALTGGLTALVTRAGSFVRGGIMGAAAALATVGTLKLIEYLRD